MRGSSRTPPAPLCDGTSSLRLDERGQRVERVRRFLLGTGLCCVTFFFWLGGIVAAVISGGGEPSEELAAYSAMAGVMIGGIILLLAGLLIGRLTADWWQPCMKETAPTGRSGDGLSVGSTQGASVDSEREAKRRYRMAKRVRRQIRKARIFDRRLDGGGTLLTEPILVLHGRPRRNLAMRDFAIFDQEGNQLGSAVRMQDPTSESPGSAWISEVRDSQGRSVLTIRLAARRRWPKSVPTKTGTYAVCSPDGSAIANIGQLTKHASRTVTAGEADAIARLDKGPARLDGGPAMTISDAEGREVARIASNRPWYVLDCKAPVDEPLRRLVLAASIVWDDAGPESTS
jgi:hypothetical protein